MITDYYYYFYCYYVRSCHIKILFFVCLLLSCNGTYCTKTKKLWCWRRWWRGLSIMEIGKYYSLHWFLLRMCATYLLFRARSSQGTNGTNIHEWVERGKPRWWMSCIIVTVCQNNISDTPAEEYNVLSTSLVMWLKGNW